VGSRGFGCAFDGRAIGLGAPEGDVLGHRRPEEQAILKDESDTSPELIELEVPNVDAVDQQSAPCHVEEAGHEAEQRALARAGQPQEGHAFAGFASRSTPRRTVSPDP